MFIYFADATLARQARPMTKALVVSGTHSGCGKTSLTLGLLAALARQGFKPAPFKTGPDFIDPGLHELACGVKSHNLDSWMLPSPVNQEIFARHAYGADLAVIEGAMGLFDGACGSPQAPDLGSAAHMAKLLGVPVLLVIDASGMATSAAAVAQGFAGFDPKLTLAGVVFNRVGGPGHRRCLNEAMAQTGLPVLGLLPKFKAQPIPSRHLGLITAQDFAAPPGWLRDLADWVQEGLDLPRLLNILPNLPLSPPADHEASPVVRLGVSRDRAFCFCYAENLRLLRQAGAELIFFSPMSDPGLPKGLNGLYLTGGYPELHAEVLTANRAMRRDIKEFCGSGRPVYAECGGFMYLMEAIWDLQGRKWPMAGVFPYRTRMGESFAALGYREVNFSRPTPLGGPGTTARGHEFHYSRVAEAPAGPFAYVAHNARGEVTALEGLMRDNVLASYVHLHFASNPGLAQSFVAAMAQATGRP